MNKYLFDNPGEKLKTFAKVYFWLVAVSSIICAFAFGTYKGYSYYTHSTTREFSVMFLIYLFIGPLAGYLTALPLYGLGELITKSSQSANNLESINKTISTSPEQKEKEAIEEALRF